MTVRSSIARVFSVRRSRQEVDCHRRRFHVAEVDQRRALFELQVDVADGDVQVIGAIPRFIADHRLVAHRQAHLFREGGGHHHQRQAIARPRFERLRRGARDRSVVLELQVAAVQRVDQLTALVRRAPSLRELARQVAAHLGTDRQRGIAVDRHRGGLEQLVVKQRGRRRHRRRAGAAGEQGGQQQNGSGLHGALQAGPPAAGAAPAGALRLAACQC
jgi:hypothetical protein